MLGGIVIEWLATCLAKPYLQYARRCRTCVHQAEMFLHMQERYNNTT